MGEETPETIDNINAWFAERAKHQSLSAVLAETTAQFDALTAVITSIPASDLLTPGVFGWLGDWLVDMPIGPASLGFSFSHLHADHVPDIRAWLKRETGVDPMLPQEPPTFGFVE